MRYAVAVDQFCGYNDGMKLVITGAMVNRDRDIFDTALNKALYSERWIIIVPGVFEDDDKQQDNRNIQQEVMTGENKGFSTRTPDTGGNAGIGGD